MSILREYYFMRAHLHAGTYVRPYAYGNNFTIAYGLLRCNLVNEACLIFDIQKL
jgi:hypothetical protein